MGRRKTPQFIDLKTLDKELRSQKLLNERRVEVLGTKRDYSKKAATPEVFFDFPKTEDLIQSPENAVSFLFKTALDPLICGRAQRSRGRIESSSHIFGGGPWDLKHSHLIELFRKGHFNPNETDSPKKYHEKLLLKVAGYLALKGITRAQELSLIIPAFPEDRLKPLQAKVYAEVEKTLPERFKKFMSYWDDLTEAQQEAVIQIHFDNEDDLTQAEIAKNLGISLDSLKDRLKGAIKKLESHFINELTPLRSNKPKYWSTLFHLKDTRQKGMLRRSECVKVHPLYRVDPATNEKTLISPPEKLRIKTPQPGIEAIKRWEALTVYQPTYKGTSQSRGNAHNTSAILKLIDAGKQHLGFVTGDEKAAFKQVKPLKFKKNESKANGRGLVVKKIQRKRKRLVTTSWTVGLPDTEIDAVSE